MIEKYREGKFFNFLRVILLLTNECHKLEIFTENKVNNLQDNFFLLLLIKRILIVVIINRVVTAE